MQEGQVRPEVIQKRRVRPSDRTLGQRSSKTWCIESDQRAAYGESTNHAGVSDMHEMDDYVVGNRELHK
jgi:hypothetical protein